MSDYINYKNYSITLGNLKLPDLPPELEVDGERFIVKKEFHITLLNLGHNAKIINPDNIDGLKAELIKSFYEFIDKQPLTDYELTNDLRLVNVDGNQTIVVLVKMPKIKELFAMLGQKYGVDLPVQPTHITLYTLPTDTIGIAINSYQMLEEISRPIDLPEIKKSLGLT